MYSQGCEILIREIGVSHETGTGELWPRAKDTKGGGVSRWGDWMSDFCSPTLMSFSCPKPSSLSKVIEIQSEY